MSKPSKQQHGAALMLLVFIIAIVMTTYLVKSFNSEALKIERKQQVTRNLASAKDALMAWAVSNELHPGQFPYPDHLETTTPIYDGRGDCGGNPISNPSLLLGQLPIYGSDGCVSPEEGLGIDAEDGYGNRLWYAVSPDLVHNYAPTGIQLSDPIINPSIVNDPTKQWLRVLDKNGTVISNRVAAVIIAPGEAIGNQSRSNTAAADNYLDSFQIGASTYSNSNINSLEKDFIIGDALEHVDDTDTTYTRPYLFNDKLIYITIDELMVALEKRVAREAISSLNNYYLASDTIPANRYYPYASLVGGECVDGLLLGGLPTLPTGTCPTPELTSSDLPPWFKQNKWEQFMFYAISSDCSLAIKNCDAGTSKLAVGSAINVNAIIISTGAEIITVYKTQDRLNSGLIEDYLDSLENISTNEVYDAVGTPLTSIYNDQMFIVAP